MGGTNDEFELIRYPLHYCLTNGHASIPPQQFILMVSQDMV